MNTLKDKEMKDVYKLRGILEIIIRDQYGNLKDSILVKNLITTMGIQVNAERIAGIVGARGIAFMALGAGTTAAVDTDQSLEAQFGVRIALEEAPTLVTVNVPNDGVRYHAIFLPDSPLAGLLALTEAGLFYDAAGPSCCNRVVFPVVNKQPMDTFELFWTVYGEQ